MLAKVFGAGGRKTYAPQALQVFVAIYFPKIAIEIEFI
jgi:hypothetical protein